MQCSNSFHTTGGGDFLISGEGVKGLRTRRMTVCGMSFMELAMGLMSGVLRRTCFDGRTLLRVPVGLRA